MAVKTAKQKKLAAMYGDKNKITRGDIITAAKRKAGKAKGGLKAAVKKIKADKGKTVFSDRLKSFQKQTSMKMKSPKLVRMKALAAQTKLGRRKK